MLGKQQGLVIVDLKLVVGLFNSKLRLLIIVVVLSVLSSCGSPMLNFEKPLNVDEASNFSLGTGGELIEIESENVKSAGYNQMTDVLIIEFRNGAIYEYYQVPTSLWSDFLAAQPDAWSQVGYPRLVKGGYEYKRIK
jgi:hypothetical protein